MIRGIHGAAMNHSKDVRQIAEVIHKFFSCFDNRDGRGPSVAAVTELFLADSVIARATEGAFELTRPGPFAEPRVELLRSGRLVDFHEWETAATTEVQGRLAARRSRYAKEGRLDGQPYAGAGTKLFQLIKEADTWRILSVAWEDDPI
jgi:hypothetical protein